MARADVVARGFAGEKRRQGAGRRLQVAAAAVATAGTGAAAGGSTLASLAASAPGAGSAESRPLDGATLPLPLTALDGKAEGAAPEDAFTWDTVTVRMPKIMDSVLESLPEALAADEALLAGVRALQQEMREGAPLRELQATGPWVNAESWNEDLKAAIAEGLGWHDAGWWLVENYMYKRLLEVLAPADAGAGASYDPFTPQKQGALKAAEKALQESLTPLMELTTAAEETSASSAERRTALQAAVLRSLWGNQADLSLSAGKVLAGDQGGLMISDHMALATELLEGSAGKQVAIVLDNHGMEVLCDLVLVDALFRAGNVASVTLHVKDSPVFVSDVTAADVPGILQWLEEQDSPLASRLRSFMDDGKLKVLPHEFYTSAKAFWAMPAELKQAYQEAEVVILKGDANYRRLLGDLHWPYDTDFAAFASSFWPSHGLVALRTMKSGVALGISAEKQAEAIAARPKDWLTSGVYGQVLASQQR